MRIATWNINSIRIREETLRHFVEQGQPDILCLQETKVTNDQFPYELVSSLGFNNVLIEGEKSYNGVAILAKFPLNRLDNLSLVNQDKRHIAANIPGTNIELHNFYVPAGGDEPDITINPKFKHKLDYVEAMTAWLQDNKKELIVLGDLNIAPYEQDVWSHKQLLDVVSHTPQEVERFNAMKLAGDLEDCLRKFYPLDQKLYSWWSYRNHDWQKSNRGRRLDHILVTKPLIDRVTSGVICSERRNDQSPSDHVPVMIALR